ncbi:MAG: hypothetical protein K2M44_03705, partial [Clostridia bacterium]|nr:hypothetical protein [Clostridia bacterium]
SIVIKSNCTFRAVGGKGGSGGCGGHGGNGAPGRNGAVGKKSIAPGNGGNGGNGGDGGNGAMGYAKETKVIGTARNEAGYYGSGGIYGLGGNCGDPIKKWPTNNMVYGVMGRRGESGSSGGVKT